MDTVEVETLLYRPPAEVFDVLVDFPRYADYSEYLHRVARDGDGGPGTEYHLQFRWWRLRYTAHARVTAVDPPRSLDWEVTTDLDARGRWLVDPAPSAAPPDREAASRVTFRVDYDPSSVGGGVVDLPPLVSLDWVVHRVEGLIVEEGERVVERLVADLEGQRRRVDLAVRRP